MNVEGVAVVQDVVRIAVRVVVMETKVELQENVDEGLAVESEMDDYQKSPRPK